MKYGFGIDLGGTTVKIAYFNEAGKMLEKWEIPTDTSENGIRILPDIAASVRAFLTERKIADSDILGLGIGVPGPVNAKGVVNRCINLGWDVFNIAQKLTELTGFPVKAGNDANVAALGEFWKGGGQGCDNMVFVTLGTGVGGGIIANGQLVRGVHFTAGEYSFVNTNADEWENTGKTMACQCSTTTLLQWYRARRGLPADAPMNGRQFFDAANAGEPEALEVLERFCKMVAVQIYNLTVLLDVEKVAIGGGISKQPILVETLNEVYEEYILRGHPFSEAQARCLPRPEIVPCRFLSEANQIGAFASYQKAFLEN